MLPFVLLIAVQVLSIGCCVIANRRLHNYINRYRFGESVYTLLFGFLRLRYFVWGYVFFIGLGVLVSSFFAISFLVL